MMEEFRAATILVVDYENVTIANGPDIPKVEKSVDSFTDLGKTVLFRATLEAERHYCGNTSEELTGADVVPTDQELMACLIDPRLVNSLPNLGLSSIRDKGFELLKEVYVSFGKQADQH